jgi:hypothetical protein
MLFMSEPKMRMLSFVPLVSGDLMDVSSLSRELSAPMEK